jgi:hypothetical protein
MTFYIVYNKTRLSHELYGPWFEFNPELSKDDIEIVGSFDVPSYERYKHERAQQEAEDYLRNLL